jgi:hypothetical protein
MHLDLSFNKFTFQDTEIMALGLRKNHTIHGLHFEGNEGRIDSLGFLNPSNAKVDSPKNGG